VKRLGNIRSLPIRPLAALLLSLLAVSLAGCAGTPRAPVIDRTPGTLGSPAPSPPVTAKPAAPPVSAAPLVVDRPETYTVRRGDTLYQIALDNGLDYREIAEWNALADPNMIREGQVLRLKPSATVQVRPVTAGGSVSSQTLSAADGIKTEPRALRLPYSEENLALIAKSAVPPKPAAPAKPETTKPEVAKPSAKPEAVPAQTATAEGEDDKIEWGWPSGGRVLAGFSEPSNKGVDIAGKKGEPVFASAAGKVVYIGEGLRGYGKLVIVKHNNTYLSAYAHNDAILVKEQQAVSKGQKIAEIGNSGTDTTKLHFEIRRQGKPVDPMKFLPPR